MKVALIQFNASADKTENLRRSSAMVKDALVAGAKFVLLPEVFSWRGNTRDRKQVLAAAQVLPGESCAALAQLARQHKAYILLGSVIERARGRSKFYNTSVLLNAQGRVAAKYRKIHLFDAVIGDTIIREADNFFAGRRGTIAHVGEFKVGLSICYDLRFPALYQGYSRAGANVLTVPSCFTKKTGQAHWEALLRARAIENLSYVLAPAQVGVDARGIEAYGHSMMVSPWGEVLACGSGNKEEIVYGTIDKGEIKKAREILPGIIKF